MFTDECVRGRRFGGANAAFGSGSKKSTCVTRHLTPGVATATIQAHCSRLASRLIMRLPRHSSSLNRRRCERLAPGISLTILAALVVTLGEGSVQAEGSGSASGSVVVQDEETLGNEVVRVPNDPIESFVGDVDIDHGVQEVHQLPRLTRRIFPPQPSCKSRVVCLEGDNARRC